jgi:hypothetical protein
MSLPDFNQLRAGNPECPSDFALDRFVSGELAAAQSEPIQKHTDTCQTCQTRLTERRAGFDAMDGVDPRRMLARIRTATAEAEEAPALGILGWLRRLAAPLVVATVAAAVLLIPRKGPDDAVVRTKGGFALHVLRFTDGRAEETISGARFHSHDRLRFTVDLPRDGAVGVLGVESSGSLYTAWPLEAGTPRDQKAGTRVELPGAVELDDARGQETLYGVLCPQAAQLAQCRSRGTGQPPACPAGCETTPFTLEKE